MLSYAIDYFFWKLDVRGYHLTSILWHVLAALGVYGLVTHLYDDRLSAFLAALFFVIHPAHTEAVAYMSGRADPMFLSLLLLAFIFYIRGTEKKGVALTESLLIAVCFVSALLCKEHALIFGALIAVYHAAFSKKIKWVPALAVAAITSGYLFFRLSDYQLLGVIHPYKLTLAERLPGVFSALAQYARLLVLPFGLHMEYGMKLLNWWNPSVMAGIALFLIALYVLYVKRTNREIFFPLAWFFVAIIPVSNLFMLNAAMAEHWIYLPSVGIFTLTALVLTRGLQSRHRTVVLAGTIAATLFFSILTIRQNETWREAVSFYERTLRFEPNSSRMYNNLGAVLKEQGKMEEARRAIEKAVEINPEIADSQFNLGYFYAIEGRLDEALACYQKTITLNPRHYIAYNNIGGIYEATDNDTLALSFYRRALGVNPQYEQAARNLQSLLQKQVSVNRTND